MMKRLREWFRSLGAADRTPGEVASIVEGFLKETGGEWDWDDLMSVTIRDHELNEFVAKNIVPVGDRFPPTKPGHYTNDEGEKWLWQIVAKLREMERDRLARTDQSSGDTTSNLSDLKHEDNP